METLEKNVMKRFERAEMKCQNGHSFECNLCSQTFTNETFLSEPQASCHEKVLEPEKFSCDLCSYTSNSRKGLNIHKGAKHKPELSETKSKTASNCLSPTRCIKSDDGCTETLTSYSNSYTAICSNCENSWKTS